MLNRRVIIILAIIAVILLLLFIFRRKLFGNMGAYDKGKSPYKYFLYSEFDSPIHRPDDDALPAVVPTSGRWKGTEMVRDSGKNNMKTSTLSMLDKARDILEKGWNMKHPAKRIVFRINSGYRTQAHNDSLKGSVKNSAHILGHASDISTRGYSNEQINEMMKALYQVGFRRFGVYNTFIHVDNATDRSTPADWHGDGYNGHLYGFKVSEIPNLIS